MSKVRGKQIEWFFLGVVLTGFASYELFRIERRKYFHGSLGNQAKYSSRRSLDALNAISEGNFDTAKTVLSLDAAGIICMYPRDETSVDCDADCQTVVREVRKTSERIPELKKAVTDCEIGN